MPITAELIYEFIYEFHIDTDGLELLLAGQRAAQMNGG